MTLAILRARLEKNIGDVLAVLFLAGYPFAYFYQETFRQAVFSYGDILLFFRPTHLAYAAALRDLRLPLWEPNMLAGFPLFAEGQISALYPLHVLLYGLLPIDIATDYDILIHLAWVSVGTFLFARTIRLSTIPSVLAAISFALGGFFFPRLQHMSVLSTASWLPWLLWAWEKLEREPAWHMRLRWFALLCLMGGAQLLGGHPQFAFSGALLVVLYASVRWVREPDETRRAQPFPLTPSWLSPIDGLSRRWGFGVEGRSPSRGIGVSPTSPPPQTRGGGRGWGLMFAARVARGVTSRARSLLNLFFEYFAPFRLIPVIAFFAIGAIIAAAQLMPTFELAGFTNRASGLDARFFNAYSLRLPHFLLLLHPFLAGNPMPTISVEVIGYVSLTTLFLAIAAPFLRRDRRVVFFVVIALVALFLGLGDLNIFYRALRHLPLFNYFRVPSRFLYWYTFAAAMLAGITLDYLLRLAPASTLLTRGAKLALLFFTIAVSVVIGLVPFTPVSFWISLWAWLPLIFGCGVVWLLLGARRGLFPRSTLAAVAIGFVVFDLACFGAVYAKTYDSSSSVADFYRPPDSLSALQGLSPQEGRILTSTWIIPWEIVERESLYPNVSLTWGVPNAIGYTPLLPQRTADYIEQLNAQTFNLMNIRYYVIPQMLPTDPGIEGEDLLNKFNLDPINQDIALPPTAATKLRITSSLSQSTDWAPGKLLANIYLATQDGRTISLPFRAGIDSAEWAFERTDVQKVLRYPMPSIATSFPASSAFPTESHIGHTYLAEYDLANGTPQTITGIYIYPLVPLGHIHIESLAFVTPDGKRVSLAHLVGHDDQALVYRSNHVAIYSNPDALPRAFIVHEAHLADDMSAENELYRDDFKPLESLILASGDPLPANGPQRDNETVSIVEYKNEKVVLNVHASADAYVFLSDSWYPGWNATLDGAPVPIQRADLIFRAVRVTPGDHRIEMTYQPTSLYIGAAISAIALLFVTGLIVLSFRAARI